MPSPPGLCLGQEIEWTPGTSHLGWFNYASSDVLVSLSEMLDIWTFGLAHKCYAQPSLPCWSIWTQATPRAPSDRASGAKSAQPLPGSTSMVGTGA